MILRKNLENLKEKVKNIRKKRTKGKINNIRTRLFLRSKEAKNKVKWKAILRTDHKISMLTTWKNMQSHSTK